VFAILILRLICLALLQKKVRHKDEDEEEEDWVKQIIRKKNFFCFILIEKKSFR
jgi:hypothetical protein